MDRVLLRDLRGRPKRYLTFQRVESPPKVRRKNHHVIVIDRSGSMCEDMGPMRETLVKLLAVEEFQSPDSLVSILSYSGAGDVLTHCTAVPVGQFQSRYVNTLMARGLTCMSGALEAAHDLASLSRDAQVTVTLHSDGYANDPGVASEARRCRELAKRLHGVAVLNTVAHRSNSDFRLLAELANLGGGACVQASGVKATYEALHGFQQAVVGDSALVTIPTNGAGALLFNRASGKVLLSHDPLTATLTDGDECYSLGFEDSVLKTSFYLKDPPINADGLTVASRRLLVAYARGLIGMGQVTAAKEAALSSGFTALRSHLRALTGPEVAAFARKLEQTMDFAHVAETMPVVEEAPAAVTLPELLTAIGRHPRAMQVHLPSLMRHYKRRGLKRVAGRRLADGTIETPKYVTRANREGTADEGWVDVDSFDFNDAEATINMLTSQPVSLVCSVDEGGTRVPSVQGVNLEALREYRSFTIVGDGELCVDHLPCRVNSVKLHQERVLRLTVANGRAPNAFALNAQFNLDLDLLLTRDEAAEPSFERVERMLRLTVMHKLLSAAKPEVPSTLAGDQVIALREHHVTPALYYTPPTVSAYSDLKKAQADGLVDVRVSYRVTFGCRGVLHAGQLHSANEALKRRFAMPDGSEPTAMNVLTREAFPKPPEAIKRLKLGPVDELEMDVYRSAADNFSTIPVNVIANELEHERAALRDIVFSVGASGAAPESWGPALAAEDVEKLGYTVGKAERDGTFYHVGGVLVSIFAREVPYTI